MELVRSLAGLEIEGLSPFTDEWRQRAAYMFSVSMSVAWGSLELMSISHEGPKAWFTFTKSRAGILIFVLRGGLIVFIATLSLWVTDGYKLSLIGMCILVLEVIICFIWDYYFTLQNDDQEHKSQLNDDSEEEEEVVMKKGSKEELEGDDLFCENE